MLASAVSGDRAPLAAVHNVLCVARRGPDRTAIAESRRLEPSGGYWSYGVPGPDPGIPAMIE